MALRLRFLARAMVGLAIALAIPLVTTMLILKLWLLQGLVD